jgi:hypothetical protein
MLDNPASGAVQYLSSFSQITSLVGAFSSSDAITANASLPYIFLDDLLVDLKGTSASALVLSTAGSMGAAAPMSTARPERLLVEIYSDFLRDASRNIIETSGNTIQRMEQLFDYVHAVLHRTSSQPVVWGDLITVGCTLISKGQPAMIPDGEGAMQRLQSFYEVDCFGWTDTVVPDVMTSA